MRTIITIADKAKQNPTVIIPGSIITEVCSTYCHTNPPPISAPLGFHFLERTPVTMPLRREGLNYEAATVECWVQPAGIYIEPYRKATTI